tara:strand:+ start:682 stop:1269 length:588 start_codon:yes stop_codon:yes gene_type:complete
MKEIYQIMLKNEISPNQVYLLDCIKENISSPLINVSLELRNLRKKGFIDGNNKLKNKAEKLLKDIRSYYEVNKEKTSKIILGDNFHENILIYRELFPVGRLPSKKPARSSPKNLEVAFRWFFKNFDYNWETVIKATAMYVDEYETSNYLYMQTSQYFIRKQAADKSWNSTLSDYCEIVLSGNDTSQGNHFSENVV